MRRRKPKLQEDEAAELELPFGAVACPHCRDEVTVEGFSLNETLWLHEYDCAGITKLVEPSIDAELRVKARPAEQPRYVPLRQSLAA